MAEEIAEQAHGRRPGQSTARVSYEEMRPCHARGPGGQGPDHAQPGDKAGEKNGPDAVPVKIALRQLERFWRQEEKASALLEPGAGPAVPQPEADVVADHG